MSKYVAYKLDYNTEYYWTGEYVPSGPKVSKDLNNAEGFKSAAEAYHVLSGDNAFLSWRVGRRPVSYFSEFYGNRIN